MKKAISILLSLCFLLALAGCSGPKETAEAIQQQPTPASFGPAEVSEVLEEAAQNINQEVIPAIGAMAPADAYAQYADAKSKAFDRINAKLEEHQELYMSMGLAILPLAMIDLSLIPLTVVGMEGGESALAMLGAQGVEVTQNGSVYSISYQDNEGKTLVITCEYDPASDSMRSISTQNGQEILFFEYARTDDGYASQYYTWDESAQNYSWITGFFNADSLAAFGMTTTAEKQDSIFKGGGFSTDFVRNQDRYFILDGDALTVLENGEVKTY